jgi:hypothetical protein
LVAPASQRWSNNSSSWINKSNQWVRSEIIDAVKQCETSGLRAITIYGKRKINGFTAETIVDVTCAPKFH